MLLARALALALARARSAIRIQGEAPESDRSATGPGHRKLRTAVELSQHSPRIAAEGWVPQRKSGLGELEYKGA